MNKTATGCVKRCAATAFTLIELIAVIAIISILIGITAPALRNWGGPARTTAITLVMNTLEQARISALETGHPVSVVFWKKQPLDQDMISIWTKKEDDANYTRLSHWRKISQQITFQNQSAALSVFSISEARNSQLIENVTRETRSPGGIFSILTFSSTGGIIFPTGKSFLRVILTEETESKKINPNNPPAGFDIISISQFTGRAQLDFSTDPKELGTP